MICCLPPTIVFSHFGIRPTSIVNTTKRDRFYKQQKFILEVWLKLDAAECTRVFKTQHPVKRITHTNVRVLLIRARPPSVPPRCRPLLPLSLLYPWGWTLINIALLICRHFCTLCRSLRLSLALSFPCCVSCEVSRVHSTRTWHVPSSWLASNAHVTYYS